MQKNKQYIALIILIIIALAFYFAELFHPFNLIQIKEEETKLLLWLHTHPISSIFILFTSYIFCVCFAIPTSTLLSILGGILYPLPYAIALSAFSETLGALIFFTVVRSTFKRSFFKEKFGRKTSLYKAYQKSPVSYLLCSRFSHLVPYWIINAAAALLKTKPWTFIWTTFVGVLPFSYLASQTGSLLKHTQDLQYKVLTPAVKFSFLLLALLALTPVLWKALTQKKRFPF